MDNMKVYKFGGASVKDAAGVRNIASIVGAEKGRLFVIVSAMGKTTNALEGLLDTFYDGKTALALERLQNIVDFHNRIIAELLGQAVPARPGGPFLYGTRGDGGFFQSCRA